MHGRSQIKSKVSISITFDLFHWTQFHSISNLSSHKALPYQYHCTQSSMCTNSLSKFDGMCTNSLSKLDGSDAHGEIRASRCSYCPTVAKCCLCRFYVQSSAHPPHFSIIATAARPCNSSSSKSIIIARCCRASPPRPSALTEIIVKRTKSNWNRRTFDLCMIKQGSPIAPDQARSTCIDFEVK